MGLCMSQFITSGRWKFKWINNYFKRHCAWTHSVVIWCHIEGILVGHKERHQRAWEVSCHIEGDSLDMKKGSIEVYLM